MTKPEWMGNDVYAKLLELLEESKYAALARSIPGMGDAYCAGRYLDASLKMAGYSEDERERIGFSAGRLFVGRDVWKTAKEIVDEFTAPGALEEWRAP